MTSHDSLAAERRQTIERLRIAKRRHRPTRGLDRKLARITHAMLRQEVAAARRAGREQPKADAPAFHTPSLFEAAALQ